MQSVQFQDAEPTSRRRFFIGAIYGLWGLISAMLAAPAAVYLLFPPKARKTQEWVPIGDITSLTPNVPSEMTFRKNRIDGWKVMSEKSTAWVIKDSANRVTAFGPQCTHLGCAYHWDDGKSEFLCPCHNSLFGPDGRVISGPAPRPLDRYETKVEGNKLLVGRLKSGGERTL